MTQEGSAPFRWGKPTEPKAAITAAPVGQSLWRFCLPIPNRAAAQWKRHQWYWWGLLLRRLRCALTHHEWVARPYPVRNQPFVALECDRCATRAGVVEP